MAHDDRAEARFRALFDRHYRSVLAYFRRRLPGDDAFDAAEDVFLVAWRRLDDVPDDDQALPWLYGIAHNVLRNHQRSGRRALRLRARLTTEPPVPVPNPGDQVADRAEQAAVLAAMDRLPFNDREVLRLAYWEELPHTQIGSILGCSPGAVAVRVHRAIRRLGKGLRQAGHERESRTAVLGKEEE